MACRSDPRPLSSVVVTSKIAASAEAETKSAAKLVVASSRTRLNMAAAAPCPLVGIEKVSCKKKKKVRNSGNFTKVYPQKHGFIYAPSTARLTK
jgi:hypothetical protein